MAISLFQKLKLGLRGWNRRRAESAARREEDFLARSTTWAKVPETPRTLTPEVAAARTQVDLEGLQVAYLEGSGAIEHYFDVQTGDVVELRDLDEAGRVRVTQAPARYRRVPQRNDETEALDRLAFIRTVEKQSVRQNLESALRGTDPAGAFRRALATDRAVERAWYNFKNQRAAEAITRWLGEIR
jgi:hypothetical protein